MNLNARLQKLERQHSQIARERFRIVVSHAGRPFDLATASRILASMRWPFSSCSGVYDSSGVSVCSNPSSDCVKRFAIDTKYTLLQQRTCLSKLRLVGAQQGGNGTTLPIMAINGPLGHHRLRSANADAGRYCLIPRIYAPTFPRGLHLDKALILWEKLSSFRRTS